MANGVRVSLAYDAADRLVRLANVNSSGVTISSFRDTWDNANNRVNRQEADGTLVSWSYDASYQLTRERRSGMTSAYDTTYSYDPAGNRVLKSESGARTTITLDAANQLVKSVAAAGATTFSFDQNGNQRLEIAPAGGATTTNAWDFENRLTKVQLASGVVNTFTFSGDGKRVQTQDSSGTAKQIYDGQKVLLETDQTNTTQVVYTNSPGVYGDLVSQKRLTVPHYHIFDPLGSTDRLVSTAQAVTDTYIYKAFGEILLAGATVNPLRFVGRLGYAFDVDRVVFHARRRDLASVIARWLRKDPAGFRGGPNGYWYARNRPLIHADPSGAISISIVTNKMKAVCGNQVGATYKIQLDVKPHCDGYLVQHVQVWCDIVACPKYKGDPPCPTWGPEDIGVKPCADFFEAWHIGPDQDTVLYTDPDNAQGSYTDKFGFFPTKNSCGSVYTERTLKFFCIDPNSAGSNGVGTGDLDTNWQRV